MNNELLPIGKMARMNRVSISTLRLYDEKGLIKPRYVDPETGYRYYSIEQNARLDMIAYMKELGMSLSEIGQVLQKEDLALVEELLARKNEQLHEQMRQLKARHDAVERAIQSIERYRKSPTTGTLSLEYIDQRYIWGIPCAENFYQIVKPRSLFYCLTIQNIPEHSPPIYTILTPKPTTWSPDKSPRSSRFCGPDLGQFIFSIHYAEKAGPRTKSGGLPLF